nr:hypothetical protein [Micromonospora sp. DSM 115978]
MFDQLGGFDPRYFMYGEDVDLCVRARQLGWDPVITPTAEVVHHVGASSSRWVDKHVMVMRGKVTLARSHWRGWRRAVCLTMLSLGVVLRAASGTVQQALGRKSRRSDWPALLRRRAEWSGGYPVAVPVADVTDPNLDAERSPIRKTNE